MGLLVYDRWLEMSIEERLEHFDEFMAIEGNNKIKYIDLVAGDRKGKERTAVRKRINKVLDSRKKDESRDSNPKNESRVEGKIEDKKVVKSEEVPNGKKEIEKKVDSNPNELRVITEISSLKNELKELKGEFDSYKQSVESKKEENPMDEINKLKKELEEQIAEIKSSANFNDELAQLRAEFDAYKKEVGVVQTAVPENEIQIIEGEIGVKTIQLNKELLREFVEIAESKYGSLRKRDIYNHIFKEFVDKNRA